MKKAIHSRFGAREHQVGIELYRSKNLATRKSDSQRDNQQRSIITRQAHVQYNNMPSRESHVPTIITTKISIRGYINIKSSYYVAKQH